MGACEHGGRSFEVVNGYSLPDDAWQYELRPVGGEAALRVLIPDATPDGPFTPRPSTDVRVQLNGGELPWPILARFMALVQNSGNLGADTSR